MTYKKNQKQNQNQNKEIDSEGEDSPLQDALYRAGVQAARRIARSIYTISSQELNLSAHIAVYWSFVSVFCGDCRNYCGDCGDCGDISQIHSDMNNDMKHISDLPLSTQDWDFIFAPIRMYKEINGDFLPDIPTIAKELIRFATSSFRIHGGYVESSPGSSDDKPYDAICKTVQQFCDLRLISPHTPLRILNPLAGTYAGVCLYALCHYKMSENIEARWSITAVDPDPVRLASANCMLALCEHIWNTDLGVSFTMQSGTFLFSETQKEEVKELLMHHPKKERHVQKINPVDMGMFERGIGTCNHEGCNHEGFDLIIMALREEESSYPSEVLRYLEAVYQTGFFEYMHIKAISGVSAKMRVIVQEKSWLTKRDAKQYREWIHQNKPTDILLGRQHSVCIWRDVKCSPDEINRQRVDIHQAGAPSFQLSWSDLKPTLGLKLQDPRAALLIHSIRSIGQPLSSYLLGEEQDPKDDYLCAILNSQLISLFMELNKEEKKNKKSENIPIVVPDIYNPEEKNQEDLIRALHQKKRVLTEIGASQEEIHQIDTLLEQKIMDIYQIPMELREFVMQHAK